MDTLIGLRLDFLSRGVDSENYQIEGEQGHGLVFFVCVHFTHSCNDPTLCNILENIVIHNMYTYIATSIHSLTFIRE